MIPSHSRQIVSTQYKGLRKNVNIKIHGNREDKLQTRVMPFTQNAVLGENT